MAVSLPFPIESRETSTNVAAVLGSVLVNLCGMYLAGIFLSTAPHGMVTSSEEQAPEEVVVNLEEVLPQIVPAPAQEQPKEPERKAFLNTYSNQESMVAPANAPFESDRNTVAMTEKAPADPKGEAVPTQDGEKKIPFLELQEHRYKDGPDGEIPKTPQVEPGLPVMPAMLPKLPGEESKEAEKKLPDPSKEPNESENQEKQPESPDLKAKQLAQERSQDGKPGAEMKPVKPGEEGGRRETLEMANVDVAQMASALAEKLNVMDESAKVMPGAKEAMPERNPDKDHPDQPQMKAPPPELKQSAPLKARPISGSPQEAMAPLPPGAMASEPTNGVADQAAFSPEHHRNQMKGSLSNVGRTSSMDVEATPLGQYKKLVNRAIERRWHQLRLENGSFVSYGSLRIDFEVKKDGRVRGVRVVHEDANAVMTNFSLQAINSAKIPPMPEEIADLVGDDGLEVSYNILIY